MAIKIQTQETYIPVHIGDVELKFGLSDDNIKSFRENALKIQEELDQIEVKEDDEKTLDKCKDALRKGFGLFFGDENTFDEVYKISPSVVIIMDYYSQITEGISEELKERGYTQSTQSKAKKYLQNKKK